MASKKTTRVLETKLQQLKHVFRELVMQTEQMEKEIQGWPVEVIVVYGRKRQVRKVVSEQVDRIYNDSLRELGRIEDKIRETESLLHPSMGRGNKPIDSGQMAAIDERAKGSKLTFQQLAIKYSGLQDRKAQKHWAENLRKTIKRSSTKRK